MATLDSHILFLDYVASGTEAVAHAVEEIIAACRTKYQRVELFKTKRYGKILVLDGRIQSAQLDEFVYHEALVHPAMLATPQPKQVLVIGGGEGATVREVLKHPSVQKVVMVDIDEELVEFCKMYLPEWHQGAFSNPKLEYLPTDGRKYVQECTTKFDVVIIDLSEPVPGGPAYYLYTKEFYNLVKNVLTANGVAVVQSDAPVIQYAHTWTIIVNTLKHSFNYVLPYAISVNSFGGPWAFTLASEAPLSHLTGDYVEAEIEKRELNSKLKMLDGQAFIHMVNLPKHLRKMLEEENRIFSDKEPPKTYEGLPK